MTELLSREREFLKLNEELDKIATTALEHQQQHQQHQQQQHQQQQHQQQQQHTAANGVGGKGESRYLTYTKGKGPSTLLKKRGDRGAGDCAGIDSASEPSNGALKPLNRANHSTAAAPGREYGRQTRGGKTNVLTASNVSNLTAMSSARQDDDNVSIPDSRKEGAGHSQSTATTPHRRNIKSPDSSTRTYSRTSNRAQLNSTATFTVKYRNPKFVESPSLEVLVRDESTMLKQSLQSVARMAASEAESVTSANVESASTAARRSQPNATKPKQVSTEGLIKFLKSKIAILEEDHERISQEMAQQKELLDKTLERHKKVEQQRDLAYSKHNALTDQLTKVESQLDEANRRIKERMLEQAAQQKELEIARRELKLLTQTNTNLEKRLYRANEELENTKNALTLMKNSERELKETMRVENDGKDKQIKSLKKQRADLLNAYKKQLFLIDNLKRQNICMEQSKMIGFGEKEFTKVLEWNAKG